MPEFEQKAGFGGPTLRTLLLSYERQLIQSALAAAAGNQRRAAATLGVLPTTLHEKMKRLGLIRRAAPTVNIGSHMQPLERELAS
jgi:DNA-binding NtrC family response regulator